jgi:AraC family transcriptional activator of pobA
MVHCEQIHERSSTHQYRIDPHVHDGLIQVLLLTQGEGEVTIDGAATRVRAPGLIVVPTRHVHGFHFSVDVDGPVVTAAQQPLESLAAVAAPDLLATVRRPLVCRLAELPRLTEALLPLFDAIDREMRLHVRGEGGAGTALLLALFVQIERIVRSMPAADSADAQGRSRKAAQVERFRALVDARFHERLTLADYADTLGISAGQLSRLCREVRGESALDVINARVVHEAERELVYSILSVKQVAALLGFDDEAYFGRFFKKHTGRSPTEFRAGAQRLRAPPDGAA